MKLQRVHLCFQIQQIDQILLVIVAVVMPQRQNVTTEERDVGRTASVCLVEGRVAM